MRADGLESAVALVFLRLKGCPMTVQGEAHQPLRAAQIGPAAGRVIQRGGEVVGLGDEVPGSSSGHPKWHHSNQQSYITSGDYLAQPKSAQTSRRAPSTVTSPPKGRIHCGRVCPKGTPTQTTASGL